MMNLLHALIRFEQTYAKHLFKTTSQNTISNCMQNHTSEETCLLLFKPLPIAYLWTIRAALCAHQITS